MTSPDKRTIAWRGPAARDGRVTPSARPLSRVHPVGPRRLPARDRQRPSQENTAPIYDWARGALLPNSRSAHRAGGVPRQTVRRTGGTPVPRRKEVSRVHEMHRSRRGGALHAPYKTEQCVRFYHLDSRSSLACIQSRRP
jgi:hypothetical protein